MLNFLKLKALPERLRFEIVGANSIIKKNNLFERLNVFFDSNEFVALETGVIIPCNSFYRSKINLDLEFLKSMPIEDLKINLNAVGAYPFLKKLECERFEKASLRSYYKEYLEQRLALGLNPYDLSLNYVNSVCFFDNLKINAPLRLSIYGQFYFSEIVQQNLLIKKNKVLENPRFDYSRGYIKLKKELELANSNNECYAKIA